MIVPSSRLIRAIALVGVPSVLGSALLPATATVSGVVMAGLLLAIVVDAIVQARVWDGIDVRLPTLLRLIQDRKFQIPVSIHNSGRRKAALRVGLAFPTGTEARQSELSVDVPGGAGPAECQWTCVP